MLRRYVLNLQRPMEVMMGDVMGFYVDMLMEECLGLIMGDFITALRLSKFRVVGVVGSRGRGGGCIVKCLVDIVIIGGNVFQTIIMIHMFLTQFLDVS